MKYNFHEKKNGCDNNMEWYMNLYGIDGGLIRRIKATTVSQLVNWIAYYESRPGGGLKRFTAWTEKNFTPDVFPPIEPLEMKSVLETFNDIVEDDVGD